MGLKIHTLAEIPDSVSKSYYLYILDYYNWDEPIGNTLRENFDKIAEFAANNNYTRNSWEPFLFRTNVLGIYKWYRPIGIIASIDDNYSTS